MVKMKKDDDCYPPSGRLDRWHPYNFICHAVWAEVNNDREFIHL